jgi:CubicO group peptidase (beta-lactamase class C family)
VHVGSSFGNYFSSKTEMSGWVSPAFREVADTFERLLGGFGGGAAVCVYQHGECVLDLWGGSRDRQGRPWERDTMAPSFSTTKGIASTLIHIMVDRGLLDYDTPVAEYWPEFGQAGKEEITLRHVLAHQSGLYHIRQMIDDASRMLEWDYIVEAIERAEPVHPPGERTGYHGLTYGFLVGEILQRVTGKPFPELVHRELAEPLGLDGLYIGAPDEVLGRAAELIWPERLGRARGAAPEKSGRLEDVVHERVSWLSDALLRYAKVDLDLVSILDALAPRGISGFDFGAEDTLRVAIPAANGLFTARSLARIYAALSMGGELDGVRLLSRRTLAEATQRQRRTRALAVIPIDMRWRLGYHGIFTTVGVPREAFGHFGFGGSGAWADPSRELAVALIVNRGMGTPFGDTRTEPRSSAPRSELTSPRTGRQVPAGLRPRRSAGTKCAAAATSSRIRACSGRRGHSRMATAASFSLARGAPSPALLAAVPSPLLTWRARRWQTGDRRIAARPALACITVLCLLFSTAPALAAQVFHSPNDDGVPGSGQVPPGSPSVFLYLDGGPAASAPGTACNDGTGDEVCGFDLELTGVGGVTFTSFDADPGADLLVNLGASSVRINGLDPVAPGVGPQRLGQLFLSASSGEVELTTAETVGADLSSETLSAQTLVTVPEPSQLITLLSGGSLLAALARTRRRR